MPRLRPRATRKNTARMNVTAEMMLNTSACRMNGMSRLMRKNSINAFARLSFPRTRESSVVEVYARFHQSRWVPACVGTTPGALRCRGRFPYLSDRYLVELFAPAVDQRDHSARHEHRREHRGEDAETVHDREPAHGPRAENQQRQTGDERRDV